MTILEALRDPRFASGELWARPVYWEGFGKAYRIALCSDDVPVSDGGPDWPSNWPIMRKAILSDWELVTPEQVRREREK